MSACDPVRVSGSLADWVAYIFDHPVTEPAWHWALDAAIWDDTPERVTILIAETFEDSGRLLTRFSDAQLTQGFWFLVSASGSDYMFALGNPQVPLPLRLRALRSFVPIFEQVMAKRCLPQLAHRGEPDANSLNVACYMWWDILPVMGHPMEPACAEFDAEAFRVLGRLLAIPHDACRESALHGLGEWACYYPEQAAKTVDDFLDREPQLRPELAAYAQRAREGMVQ